MGQTEAKPGSLKRSLLRRHSTGRASPPPEQIQLPKPAKLKDHPGIDSLEDNP